MPCISLEAVIECDGKNCAITGTSCDVSSVIVNLYGQQSSEIYVYPPREWIVVDNPNGNKYYCPLCKKKKR